jgi:hypothetical protein
MINTVTTNTNNNVVVVTAPGPAGPVGAAGPLGPPGTITGNSGVNSTGSSIFSGSVTIIGTLTVTGSNTFINIGPARFTGSVDISGSLSAITSSAQYFSGSGAGLSNIPASAISGLNVSTFRISSGSVSASVQPGATNFIVNNGGSTLFTISSAGLGTFANGLTVNNGATSLNAGLSVSNGATLNGGTTINTGLTVNGTATVNGRNVVTSDAIGAISASGLNITTGNTTINSPTIALFGTATLNGQPITTAGDLTLNQIKTGAVTASVSTGQNSFIVQSGSSTLMNVSSSGYVSASGFIGDGSRLSNVGITYLSGSNPLINSIQVADFDNNVAVTYINGNLKFIFGTPTPPSTPSVTLSGFATDRFNKQSDSYNTLASWDVGGYTLVSAKLYYTVTGQLLDSTTTGTSFNVVQTTTGSGQTYRIEVTSSSPLDGAISQQSSTTTGTLSKSRPNVPSISISSNTVQLGISSNQIEEGATGDINFSAAYGSANAWEALTLTTTPSSSPQSVSSPTGDVSISATSNYQSPAGDNDPQITDSRSTTTTYSRIRSLRYGASTAVSFSESDLQDLEIWDTGLGGTIGTIRKGTLNPSGQSITITWTGDKYHYIVMSSAYTLSNISTEGFGVFGSFTATVVGNYRVYKSNDEQSGGAGTSITYVLT